MKHPLRSLIPVIRRAPWLLLLMLLAGNAAHAQTTPAFGAAWATGTVASPLNSLSYISATARDAAGNVYVAGNFIGTTGFGSLSLTSTDPYVPYGGGDAFVAKLDASGNYLWVRSAGGLNGDGITALAVDAAGNAYVTGIFGTLATGLTPSSAAITIGTTTLTATTPGIDNKFVAKLDAGGNWLWARRTDTRTDRLAVDASGNAYLTGSFSTATATFGSTTLSNAAAGTFGSSVFLAKLDAAGSWLWAKGAGDTGTNAARDVATDASGNVYLSGSFQSSIALGSTTLTASAAGAAFVAKLDAAGNYLWVRQLAAQPFLAADGSGNVYVAGLFQNSITLGSTTLSAGTAGYAGYSVYLGKLSATGAWLWASASSGSGTLSYQSTTNIGGVAVDGSGNAYVTGQFNDLAISFGSSTLTNTSAYSSAADAFVAKCDAQGSWLWARQVTGADSEGSVGLGADAAGNVWLVGYTVGEMVRLGSTTLTVANSFSIGSRIFSFVGKLDAQGTWLWARAPDNGGSGSQCTQSVPDGSGNLYVAGSFSGTVAFGSTTLTSRGYDDVFVAKLDASGNCLWAQQLGSAGPEVAYDLARDASGNVLVTGFFGGTLTLGSTTLTSPTTFDPHAFVAKLDASGTPIWARSIGTYSYPSANNPRYGNSLATDASGNVWLAGAFSGTATFGSTSLTATSGYAPDAFVAKLDASGTWLWARQAVGSAHDDVRGLVLDAAGNAYLVGSSVSNTLSFGSVSLSNTNPGSNGFVTKIDPAGTWLWARQVGANVADVALDAAGNLYVAGSFFGGPLTLGSSTLANRGSSDVFVAKLDASGNALWARSAGGAAYDVAQRLVLAPNGTPCLMGSFASTAASFGASSLTANGINDMFLSQLDAQGNWLWTAQAGGAGNDFGQGLSVDASGNLYLSGYFDGPTASFGALSLTSAASGKERGFVARLPAVVTSQRPVARLAPLQLYPNPAAGRHVRLLATDLSGATAELRVLNSLGQLVRHETRPLPARRLDYTLELPALPAGAYTVQLRTAAGTHTGQLLLN
ncbi:SBBP repeat-containing protein [Hymenobacter jeollabukensis]|uniref:T9SS type A sorting domain-containing protein n=1 Tax=Hymenobacter jeollabukensis TaxID=2025313 RepID=A0A5R8WSE2_9BACT|nr:SBBP repeat-containing protein [Hymenobacter jeollabukensis]TLM94103.1 T9SS type A sorting domain-containing protein [Hymenobacter jeollabukensis]